MGLDPFCPCPLELAEKPKFQALFFLIFVTLAFGAVFYWLVERWSLLDSLFLSLQR
jgi:hypothetical protein